MKVYEAIISILEKKGPLPIPLICQEVNNVLNANQKKPLLPSHIQSIVTKKKDIFDMQGGKIFIHPDKHPFSLVATIDGFKGISYQLNVNFLKNRFIFSEWRHKENIMPFENYQAKSVGNIEEFKRDIYSLKIWEWDPVYRQDEGIILDGEYWSIKLSTKGKIYKSEGCKCFPANWNKFCKSIEKLTGATFRYQS